MNTGLDILTCGVLALAVLLPTCMAAGEAGAAPASEPETLRLWPDRAPKAQGDGDADRPEITVYRPAPDRATGAAIVVCPGGGYMALMMTYEGHDIARWLVSHGIAAIVLKYRVHPYRHPVPALDGMRAMRTVRANARKWGIAPDHIGMMGFSAGGHLASWVGTHFDAGDPRAADQIERVSCRPDFMVLIYPATEYGGAESTARRVTDRTPPAFLVHAKTDEMVPVAQSARFYAALRAHHVPAKFLEFPTGAHGLGCGQGELWTTWQARCMTWLQARLPAKKTGKPRG